MVVHVYPSEDCGNPLFDGRYGVEHPKPQREDVPLAQAHQVVLDAKMEYERAKRILEAEQERARAAQQKLHEKIVEVSFVVCDVHELGYQCQLTRGHPQVALCHAIARGSDEKC